MKKRFKIVTQTKDHRTIIAVDVENAESILSYLRQDNRHKNKFIDIAKVIFEGLDNRELYKREKIDSETENVWAMRFFVGQENDRIYCQEIYSQSTRIIVMSLLHKRKKSRKNSQQENQLIKKVSGYEYEEEKK